MNERKTTKVTIPILQQQIVELHKMLDRSAEQFQGLKSLVESKDNTIQLQVQRIQVLSKNEEQFEILKKEVEIAHSTLMEEKSLKRYLEGVIKGKDDMISELSAILKAITGKKE